MIVEVLLGIMDLISGHQIQEYFLLMYEMFLSFKHIDVHEMMHVMSDQCM